ncbi:MAG TPA: MarR family transcriptional regulator [Actinomycetes bacterium]|nr:MarR family transcriptional regulator [Actinomycetes bacterium]
MPAAVPGALSRADLALASELRLAVMRLSRRLRTQRTDQSLSLSQLAVLGTLERHGPLTPRELAEHEKVSPPSMTRTLAALQERGFIIRTDHPTDGRQHLVAPTEQAVRMIRNDRRRREAFLAQRLAELSPDQRTVLRHAASILERIATS